MGYFLRYWLYGFACLLGASGFVRAQSYQAMSYQTEHGLPNNIVKGIFQDATGFMWIATDGGISRFDGKNFLNFKKELPSNYTKGFVRTRAGKLFCLSDGGLTEVQSAFEGVSFVPFLAGGQNIENPAQVIYPKDALEDCAGNIWIAESASLLRWQAGKAKRYRIEAKYLKNDFSRSFRLVEAACGQLFITTYAGFVFRFNPQKDVFERLEGVERRVYDASDALMLDAQTLWIGEATGITEIHFSPDYRQSTARHIIDLPAVSALHRDKQGRVFIGTWRKGVYMMSSRHATDAQRLNESKASVINDIFADAENNLWLCTNEGLEFLQPNSFKSTEGAANVFVQSLSYRAGQALLFAEGSRLHQVSPKQNDYAAKIVYEHGSNIYGLAQTKGRYYIGTADAQLVIWEKGNTSRIDLAKYGKAVNQLYTDQKQNVWICQYDRTVGLLRLDSTGALAFFGENAGLQTPIFAVTESKEGNLYAAGAGKDFLYRWNNAQNRFENISLPIPVRSNVPLQTHDLLAEGENIWLATNLGLFLQRAGKITLIDLGAKFAQADMRAVAQDKHGNLWIGSELGLIKYKAGKAVIFEKVNGLSNVHISHRGILCTDNSRIFVATSNGFNYSMEALEAVQPTPSPIFLRVKSDEQPVDWKKPQNFSNGITFQADFISFTYPNQPVLYQYRLKGITKGNDWVDLGTQNQILQPRMPAGEYFLEVRAKQQGNHDWSAPVSFRFRVAQAWYFTIWAVVGEVLLVLLAIWLSVALYTYRLRRQKLALSRRIAQATQEIAERAEHLHEANQQLSAQKEEIQQQKESIEEQKDLLEQTYKVIQLKNSKITDSIRYARTIQSAILPEERHLATAFSDYFVVYRPKDVVSGDFYWLLPYQNRHFFAVVDCTGHGVPGAFMSMIGHTLLYRIIKLKGIISPARILSILHNEVRVVLRQRHTSNTDGMDICLCAVEAGEAETSYKLTFAGAKLPLYYFAEGSLEILEEDRKSIGGIQNRAKYFTDKEISLQAGDCLYLRTDGIVDQNDLKRKKFGENLFSKLIEQNACLPMTEQKRLLEEAVDRHQTGTEQRDDITVLGIRL